MTTDTKKLAKYRQWLADDDINQAQYDGLVSKLNITGVNRSRH